MLNHPFIKRIGRSYNLMLHAIQKQITTTIAWILRLLFRTPVFTRQGHRPTGFVLPTTVLLLLVVSLAVGSMSLRSYQRTQQVIGNRQQQVIYNIATPALDRARAKFEYLFRGDPRFPAGIPSEGVINSLLLDGSNLLPGVADAYVLDDETELDLNEDGTTDTAWSYRIDTDEDGVLDATVAYSIILQTPQPGDPFQMSDSSDAALVGRSDALQVRNAPLSGSRQLVAACRINDPSVPLEQGWFKDEASSAVLRKNLQVDVYVQPDDPNRTLATLEFQQDRQLDQGNKWGAWFRGDIDLSPGPLFNWNGAMHTEGNLMAARTGSNNRRFNAFLVSSPNSCLYTPEASEITVASVDADTDAGIPEFRGQIIGSKAYATTFGNDESIFHLHSNPPVTTGDANVLLDRNRDSVVDGAGYGPADYSLDPIVLATTGLSQPRDNTLDYATAYDQTTWENNPINQESRVYAESEESPYLDDFFRADNRFGPNPRYGDVSIPASRTIGDEITGNLLNDQGLSDTVLTRQDSPGDDSDSVGLDGYWERRARQAGLRLIVGQRLELGDTFGWGGLAPNGTRRPSAQESLSPWNGCFGANNTNRCSEARHRLTLRDNLAAVQATAVYHASAGTANDDTPVACWASTVHPGTPQTLVDSTTFKDWSTGLESFWPTGNWFNGRPLLSNFFLGDGTNGWEYEVHPDSAINGNSDPTIQALQNLAYFAGDPNGGAPSFPPVQDNTVHPFPDMAMWGDFSVLRRIFDELWTGGYASLSIADKSTLRSAACTVGMLAYNIGYLDNLDDSPANDPTGLIPDLANRLNLLRQVAGATSDGQPRPSLAQIPQLTAANPPEAYIAALETWNTLNNAAVSEPMINLAKLLMVREQMDRDRLFGFQNGQSIDCSGWPVTHAGLENLCTNYPKYPILYSLFPFPLTGTHDEVANRSREGAIPAYIQTENTNSAIQYRVIDLTQDSVLNAIALAPRRLNQWQLPSGTPTAPPPSNPSGNPNSNRELRIACVESVCETSSNTQLVEVPFKDTALMNGREKMSVRTLNMNVELLRTSNNTLTNDFWLPNSGLIYAFREDGVREDEIVRPAVNTWGNCDENSNYETGTACRMVINVTAENSQDPPLNPTNFISPKSVDYYGDPDRRPHGFRLLRGERIDRGTNARGISLISDNPVYVQGNFNLHQSSGCGTNACRLEEFTQILNDATFNNFYTRSTLDTRFARPNQDLWRPAEILTDAITILSSNFCDGSYVDGWLTAGEGTSAALTSGDEGIDTTTAYGCVGNNRRTSFLNFMRPRRTPVGWQRENPWDANSPIAISRAGNPLMSNGNDYNNIYYTHRSVPQSWAAIQEANTRVNAVMVSGVVPMRGNQSYGGLHNFPRFIGRWSPAALNISGAFFQLNFSNYATGPFDQDAWEPHQQPITRTDIDYYRPPQRRWGYDVGLQYAQAGPIAQRFVAASALRSEFYNEPAADDPYMSNLCRAMVNAEGGDPNSSCA